MKLHLDLSAVEAQFLLETIKACQTEFRELIFEKEWYVTEVVDRLATAREILEGPPDEQEG